MATLFRPVEVNKREVPLVYLGTTLFIVSSLLTTTLAPLPQAEPRAPTIQRQTGFPANWQPADTTRGTPKTLIADIPRPFPAQSLLVPQQHPQTERLNPNTSAG